MYVGKRFSVHLMEQKTIPEGNMKDNTFVIAPDKVSIFNGLFLCNSYFEISVSDSKTSCELSFFFSNVFPLEPRVQTLKVWPQTVQKSTFEIGLRKSLTTKKHVC